MPFNKIFYPIALLLFLSACQSQEESLTDAQKLYAYFPAIPSVDTLKIALDSLPLDSNAQIPAPLFWAAIDSSFYDAFLYEPDTFDFQAIASWKVSLNENQDACLISMQQGWFQFKYLLVYSKLRDQFIGIEPVAFLYGGDGGQIICKSWIFDLKSQPTIAIRQLERHIQWSETDPEEMEEVKYNQVEIKQWSQDQFRKIPVQDSSYWIQKIPIAWD